MMDGNLDSLEVAPVLDWVVLSKQALDGEPRV
jgi:hypothetical protein